MNTKRFTPFKIPASGKLIFLPLILLVFIWLFQMFYNQLKEKTIDDFNHELMVFAQTASQGITDAFDDYRSDLAFISSIDHIKTMDDTGKKMMKAYFGKHKGQMAAITRMDEQGKILYTWPENNLAVGQSIAHQKHVKELLKTREPVISDVFIAEQGFSTIGVHIPVFDGDSFRGSIAVLIPIDYLGKQYLGKTTFRGNEKAWLLSENNIEIYCPIPGHTGKAFTENTADEISTRLLQEKIMNTSEGYGNSMHTDQPPDQESAPEERHIVFYRIPLDNTFWTILISYGDQDVYAELDWFRTQLITVFIIIFVLLAYYFYTLVRVRNIIKEEKKRKKAELSLRESEDKYRTLTESSPLIVLTHDLDGNISYVNQSGLRFFNMPLKQIINLNISDLITAEQLEYHKVELEKLVSGKTTVHRSEFYTRQNNTEKILELTGSPVIKNNRVVEVLLQAIDITERKKTEAKIRTSEQRLREAEKIGKLGHVDWSVAEQRSYWSDEIFEIYERDPGAGVPHYDEIMALHVPEDAKKLEAAVIKALNEGVDYNLDLVAKTAAGNKKYLHIIGKPVKDESGNVTNIKGTVQDISERKNAEIELKEKNIDLTLAQKIANIGNWKFDPAIGIPEWSPAVYQIYERDPSLGPPHIDEYNTIYEPDQYQIFINAIQHAIKNGIPYDIELKLNINNKTKWIRAICQPEKIETAEGHFLRGTIQDITTTKTTEVNLRESESKFRTVFNQSPIGIELYNSHGLQVDANEAALQMFGIPDISEVKHFNLFDGTSMNRERIARLRRGEVIRYQAVFDFQRVKKLGQYKTHRSGTADFDYIINPLSSDDGKIIGYLVMVQDITKRKRIEKELIVARERAEESEMKVRSMFGNTHTGILFCTPKGKILEANPAILEIVGSPSLEESLKVNLLEFEPLRRVGFSQDIEKCLKQKQVVTGKMHYTSRYGKSTFAKYYLIPIYIKNRPVGVWANINDLTDLWQTQQDLKLAKERAEESDRLKSAFLANMSHEIRTPMNGILGFAELLKETDLTPEEKNRFIGIIEKSGQRMLNIINDLIDISKIESGQMELNMQETNIPDQAEYLYTFFKPEADKKGLKLTRNFPDKDTPATMITDREKVYAVLTNLLKNAIKYTRRGSIQFGYRHIRDDAEKPFIQFFVKDTGIGIPGDRLEAIFDRFVQADIEDRHAMEGAGLGLAISKAYAEMLGGNISVESVEGKGSSFYFTIAATHETAPAKKEPAEHEPEKPDTIKKLKVLIAEDDKNSQLHLSIILKNISRETLVVNNGKDVIENVRKHPDLDLVLMDIKMPGLDGYEATREIRKFNKDIIIIAQTAYALSGDREKAMEFGCNDYIAKPIGKAKLLKLISNLFN